MAVKLRQRQKPNARKLVATRVDLPAPAIKRQLMKGPLLLGRAFYFTQRHTKVFHAKSQICLRQTQRRYKMNRYLIAALRLFGVCVKSAFA
jgi:hypothetical protein